MGLRFASRFRLFSFVTLHSDTFGQGWGSGEGGGGGGVVIHEHIRSTMQVNIVFYRILIKFGNNPYATVLYECH